MFGFLKKKFANKMTDIQVREISDFTENLSRMNSDEIGMVVVQATNMRIKFKEKMGVDFLEPGVAVMQNPNLPIILNKTIRDFQKEGNLNDAAAMMIWLHTLRSMGPFEMRPQGRKLWSQLARGFPHVAATAVSLERDFGVYLDFEGYEKIPRGLEPEPT